MGRTGRTPKNARGANQRRDWRPKFLAAFRDTGLVTEACEVAKVGRSTVYQERQRNEDFALAWADIELETTEAMEREAFRRGVEGVEKPMVSAGKLVTTVREYSDTLLIFMLKARKPEMYRDNVHVQHSGTVKTEAPELPTDEEWERDMKLAMGEMAGPVVNGRANGNGRP